MRCARIIFAAIAVGLGTSGTAASSVAQDGPFHAARAFTVRAEAYPMESAPGTQETEVAVRSASTRAVASNPRADAFAHAAITDLGLAEAYVGQQGPSASTDTATSNSDPDVVVNENGQRLEAHVDRSPAASALAMGSAEGGRPGSSGSLSSWSSSDGSSDRLVATTRAEAHDVVIGALGIGSGQFEARVELDGTPGGATATGSIHTSDATFAGVPVLIGADGLHVDEARVPVPLLDEATTAIQEGFSRGGYADIRVVQPQVEVAEDGTLARVFGGGVHVIFTNNDPVQRYFVSYTLLGGAAEILLGGGVGIPTPARPGDAAVGAGGPRADAQRPPGAPAAGSSADVPPEVAPTADQALELDRATERIGLRTAWGGRVWVLLAIAGAWLLAGALRLPKLAPARQRLAAATDAFAERYARG